VSLARSAPPIHAKKRLAKTPLAKRVRVAKKMRV
jgi:hypothetical protein